MKKLLIILCLCSLLLAFAGCSGTAPVATEASTVTEATAESTTEVTTTAESTTEATASSTDVETEEPIKEIQYTVPMDRINMSILWFYKFTVDPSVCQVSFTSPENWIPGEVMSNVEESALYNLSDGSAALSLCFASDIANEPNYYYTTENGTAYYCYVIGDYNAERFSCKYVYSVKGSDQVTLAIQIYGNFGRETADRYAFPILDSLSFPDEAVYYSDENSGDTYTAFKEVKINKEFELALAEYRHHAAQSPFPADLYISMPETWKYYSHDTCDRCCQRVYTGNIPEDRVFKSNQKFIYSSFCPDLIFPLEWKLTEEWVHEIGGPPLYTAYDFCLERQTEDGRQYLLYEKDMPAYHATSYLCYLELHASDQKYVFVFRAWADSDDTELIEKMISSIRLVEK